VIDYLSLSRAKSIPVKIGMLHIHTHSYVYSQTFFDSAAWSDSGASGHWSLVIRKIKKGYLVPCLLQGWLCGWGKTNTNHGVLFFTKHLPGRKKEVLNGIMDNRNRISSLLSYS
jgi:hypothetical protein